MGSLISSQIRLIKKSLDKKADNQQTKKEFASNHFKIQTADQNLQQHSIDLQKLKQALKNLQKQIPKDSPQLGNSLAARKPLPTSCLSCGRGQTSFDHIIPHIQGADGRMYRMQQTTPIIPIPRVSFQDYQHIDIEAQAISYKQNFSRIFKKRVSQLRSTSLFPTQKVYRPLSGKRQQMEDQTENMYSLVYDLIIPEKREDALRQLSRDRQKFNELAPILWYSVGTVAALQVLLRLQEIVEVYPLLVPPTLNSVVSNRVCNVLALLQCVASHTETRRKFLDAHIPLFLYPFLNTLSNGRPYEYLKLTSLGVIGALVKSDDPKVINFLIHTQIIPLCLRIMDRGSQLSKTVATFIIQKILSDQDGLNYLCQTFDRLQTICTVLNNMVDALKEKPSQRLFKHIVRCFNRISEHDKGKEFLRKYLPAPFKDPQHNQMMDDSTKRMFNNTIYNINNF